MKVSSVLQRDKSKYSLIKKVVVALLLLIYCPKFSFGTKNEVQLDSLDIIHEIDSLLLQFDSLFYENPQQAEVVINTTLQLSKVAEYKAGYTKSVLGTANIMASKGNFKDALDNYNQSIDLAKALNNMMLMFQCYKSRGNLFLTSGLYEDALSSYMTAMFIAEGENYQNEKIRIYNNVGLVYSKQGLYEKAKQYIKKSLSLNPPLGLENSILNNLGIQYVKLADYDSALWCYNQSIVICGKLESDVCEADPLGNIGEIYLFKQEYTKALYFLFKAKRRYESIGAKEPQIPVLSNIGRVYQNMGDYKNSIIYLEKAMKFAKEGNNPILLYKLHYNLAWAYRTAGEIDLSWDNLDDYQKLHDSIVSAESNRRLEKLLAKFEIDRKEKEIELKIAKEKAEESDKLKSAFLANMSHEIRTPMNSIIGFSNMLSSKEIPEEQKKEFIHHIQSSSEMLLGLVDDIIDIAKIEAGQLNIHKAPCKPQYLIQQLQSNFEAFKTRLEKEFLQLTIDIPEDEIAFRTDEFRLKQILSNLISNAIKFTEQGSVEIGMRLKNPQTLQFYVKDTGIGMPREELTTIFERFKRAKLSEEKKISGTGLGLAISKNLVELLGGEMWVESEPNIGSCFTFELPYLRANEEINLPVVDKMKKYNWSGKTILIAEDDKNGLALLNQALLSTNAKIIRASTGKEAVEALSFHERTDLILMDLQMPVMNGLEATIEIKEKYPLLPIIAQTAFAMEGDREKYLSAGFDDYITKPIDVPDLLAKISQFFDKSNSKPVQTEQKSKAENDQTVISKPQKNNS